MRNIGIICEGPTDHIILKEIVDRITGENNYYILLQPEPDLAGEYGNGWKGVWKWCADHAAIKEKFMKGIESIHRIYEGRLGQDRLRESGRRVSRHSDRRELYETDRRRGDPERFQLCFPDPSQIIPIFLI